MFCLCFIPYALIVFITLHLSHVLTAYSYLCLCPPPLQKNKKNSENGGVPWLGAPTGGAACVDGCAPLVATCTAHQRNTPHAARCTPANIHAAPCLLFACKTSVCWQIAKRAYLRGFGVIYKYIYIVTPNPKKIHIFCHSPHVRRLGRLKNTRPPRIYTANTAQRRNIATMQRVREHTARTHEKHTARSRPDAAKGNGAK